MGAGRERPDLPMIELAWHAVDPTVGIEKSCAIMAW
jgi:hypothetical protein